MDIDSILCILTAFLLLILSIFLLSYRKGNRLSNLLLSAFFFLNIIFVLQYLLIHLGFWFKYPPLYLTSNSLTYFMGLLLYFYTKSLCYKDFRIEKKELIHVLPFLFLVISIFAYYHLKFIFVPDAASLKGTAITQDKILTRYEILVYFCILYGFLVFYCVMSLKTLSEYRRNLKNQFSNINYIDLSWLILVIAAYFSIWLIDLVVYLLLFIPQFPNIILSVLNKSSGIINFVFAIYIVYKGLNQSDIFAGIIKEKYKTARLPQPEIDELKNKIKSTMTSQKPYLDPDLALDNLAELLSIPARQLSQVINVAFNQNFFDFISDHRIREAKQMLSDPAYKNQTILAILYDVGFNSKSSFNHLFKNKAGMTPSEFRKKFQNTDAWNSHPE